MSLFNKMLFDATKGGFGFDSTVKVPPPTPTSTQPDSVELLTEPDYMSFPVDDYSIPPQPAAAQPVAPQPVAAPPEEGIMTVDTNNTLTPEEAEALASFTGGSNSYANIDPYAYPDPPVDQPANPTPTSTPTPTGSNQTSERNPNNEGNPPDTIYVPGAGDVPFADANPNPEPINLSQPTGIAVGMPTGMPVGGSSETSDPNATFVNPYLVATNYQLQGLQPDRTGQNPFARPNPNLTNNTPSLPANETNTNGKNPTANLYYAPNDIKLATAAYDNSQVPVGMNDPRSEQYLITNKAGYPEQQYFAPQDAKYAEGGEVKEPDYFSKTADENYDIKDYLLDTIPKGISKYLLLNKIEGLDRLVGEELAGYVDTRMENYRARELQERLDRLYEGMTPEEIEAYKLAFTKNAGSSAP